MSSTNSTPQPPRSPADPIQAQASFLQSRLGDGIQFDSTTRWEDAAVHARGKVGQEAALEGRNDVRSRWKRAVFLANRLSNGRGVIINGPKYDIGSADSKKVKILETQHWLELIDAKHRYGSNLKYYHRVWVDADTKENFFRWLDHGGGKDLDLQACPRERLEKERIIYLSAEQRLNYLVHIDQEGRLRWARNGERVDTTPNRWKDAGDGKGIAPTDGTENDQLDPGLPRRESFSSFDGLSTSSSGDSRAHHHYTAANPDKGPIKQFAQKHFTPKGMTEKMLRKTLRKNTWIYVCDLDYNLFIGIKQTGTFQHSSFFGGSVSSAGLLTVKDGLVTSLSPLSGHYRTSIPYFEAFIKGLNDRGLDLHKVHVTKEEAILWGLQHWGKFNKTKGTFAKAKKDQAKAAMHTLRDVLRPRHHPEQVAHSDPGRPS
ncbi:hypothetical protein FRB99_006996 [Tulasnella sp. 403]|nr:hypothetical protein FRB99_006996 [Tulasnella sp. 403]